MVIWSKLGEK